MLDAEVAVSQPVRPVATEMNLSAHSQAALASISCMTARRARDAVFEGWDNTMAEVFTLTWLWPRLSPQATFLRSPDLWRA